MAARKIKAMINGSFGADLLAEVMEKQVPVIIDGFMKFADSEEGRDYLGKVVSRMLPTIIGGVKTYADSKEGKEYLSQMVVDVVPAIINCELSVKGKDGTPQQIGLINYIVSVGIDNFKMQLNSFKSALVRGVAGGGGDTSESAIDVVIQAMPKQWRWIAQLMPLITRFLPNGNGASNPTSSGYRGG